MSIDSADIERMYQWTLDRKPSQQEVKLMLESLKRGDLSTLQAISRIILSPEFLQISLKNAVELHLYYIHWARIKMVTTLLPPAEEIVDLGGQMVQYMTWDTRINLIISQ